MWLFSDVVRFESTPQANQLSGSAFRENLVEHLLDDSECT